MISYFICFFWGIYILLSFIGFGGIVNRLLFPNYRVDWGLRAAWGIALSLSVGGILNVTRSISSTIILIYLAIGTCYCLFDLLKTKNIVYEEVVHYFHSCRKDRIFYIISIIIFALIFIQYAGWVSVTEFKTPFPIFFNDHDDYHAYMVFPKKMLQMGYLSSDPFNSRKLFSLGGQSFLQTFILSKISENNLNILDPGIASIVVLGLLLGFCKEKKISKRKTTFIIFIFLFIEQPKINLTSLITALALFLSFFRTLEWDKLKSNPFISNACIIALITAAICSLKSTLIPACGILFTSSYLLYIIGSRLNQKAINEFVTATIFTGLFLFPWMFSMYQSSGTLLYPLLGRGYEVSVYGSDLLLPYTEFTISRVIGILKSLCNAPFATLLLLGFILIRSQPQKLAERKASLSFLITAVLGKVILAFSLGNDKLAFHSERYSFPFVYATIIAFLLISLSTIIILDKDKLIKNSTSALIVMVLGGLLVGINLHSTKRSYLISAKNIIWGLENIPLISDQEINQYTKMQNSIPEGETVITRLEKPFLLNFRRNKIFVADWPGATSLPPGIPSFKGSEALADYLILKSIRYVAYSYANEAGFQKKRFIDRVSPQEPTWSKTEAQLAFDFQDNLKQLGHTRRKIYDDGEIFVLDLLSR